MARNKLSGVAPGGPAGVVATLTAATDLQGDAVLPGDVILINNGSGAPITITLITGGTSEGLAVADPTLTITNGTAKIIGPFPAVYAQEAGTDAGWCYVDYSSITTVTRVVLSL